MHHLVRNTTVRKISILLIAFLFFLLLVTTIAEYIVAGYIGEHEQEILTEEYSSIQTDIRQTFNAYQQETLQRLHDLTGDGKLQHILVDQNENNASEIFEMLHDRKSEDISLEVYDAKKTLIAWNGTEGSALGDSLFGERSCILQGPIYSYFVIVIPLVENHQTIGYLAGKRLFDVNYPINNRFITNSAFTSTFLNRVPYALTFDFSNDAQQSPDSTVMSVPFQDIAGHVIGFGYVAKPTTAMKIEESKEGYRTIERSLEAIVSACLLFILIVFAGRISSLFRKGMLLTAGLWVFRYFLVTIDVPSAVVRSDLFNPKYFASPFGFGLASSLGEMLLTAVILSLNVIVLVHWYTHSTRWENEQEHVLSTGKKILRIVWIAIIITIILFMLRGFVALVNSAVVDSSLPYNDPTTILPSIPLASMLITLLLASFSLVLASIVLLVHALKLLRSILRFSRMGAYFCLCCILILASVLFGMMESAPLLGQIPRLCCILMAYGFAITMIKNWQSSRLTINIVVMIVVVSIGLLIPFLDNKLHDMDRSRVELLAQDIVRPEDNWLAFMLNQSLDELSGTVARRLLESGDPQDIEKMAFTGWAKSMLSREGNNCSVTYVNRNGEIVSDFHIGIPPHRMAEHAVGISTNGRVIHRGVKTQNGESVQWYTGYSPIQNSDSSTIGGVWVEISGGRNGFLRGEHSTILRNSSDNDQNQFRPLTYSEYYQGKLISSTDDRFPLDRPLPSDLDRSGMWINETIEGKDYDSYYFRDPNGGGTSWFSVSLESLGVQWHFYTFLRYIIFYFFFLGIGFVVYGIVWFARGRNVHSTVRMKLFMAFVVVSLIPVVILAYYNRQYAREQIEELTNRQLSDQTSVIVAEIQHTLGLNIPIALEQLSDEQCAGIANDVNTNFNVYFRHALQASSKPEIFSAELLDTRLGAEAFVNLFFRKKSFYSEYQSIGLFRYVVGYRPIVAQNGMVIGAIAVPTLFRQTDIDEELTRRNVFLYGTYAFAFFLALIAGTIFANQISLPIRRLREATKRLSRGEMTAELHSGKSDELGQLESAFKEMISDLRQSQEQVVKNERELAWKEMAKQVAHEIKNPLTPMKLSMQHLRQAYHDQIKDFSAILQQVSTTILDQIETLSRIASEFSHFARMPERNLQVCNVHVILEETKQLFQQVPGVTFVMRIDAAESVVRADHEELRRAFINIIRNALQAMNDTGTVIIQTHNDTDHLVLDIIDDGPGIPKEIQARLFEPAFSTKTEGTGLGLAIVKQTVKDLNGEISLVSEIGKGTTVTMILPIFKP